jgi:hypothetical protein
MRRVFEILCVRVFRRNLCCWGGGVGGFGGCLAGHESGLDARGYDVVRASNGTCISAPVSTAFCGAFTTMSGPVASNLVLLNDLSAHAQGTKVRFLGWYMDSFPLVSQKLTVSQHRWIRH